MVKTSRRWLNRILFLSSAILITGFGLSQASITLNVQVRDGDGNLLSGATVYAVHFGNQGPDGVNSQVVADGVNDGDGSADGIVQITLPDNIPFEIFADLQNSGPTVNNQMFNPNHPHVFSDASADGNTSIVVLDQSLTNRGVVIAHISNGTQVSGIFGNVRKISTGNDIGFGACITDAGGLCDVVFHNITTSNVNNTYDVSAFDPAANGGQGRGNGGQLSAPVLVNPPNAGATINIDIANGLPPDRSANSGDQNGPGSQSAGGLQGVVEDVDYSSMTVPFGGVSLRVIDSNGNFMNTNGTGVDQNGRFQFFGLNIGTTYYVQAFGGCRQDGICYDGYASTGAAMGINDFLYVSSDPVSIQVSDSHTSASFLHVQLSRTSPGIFSLPVYVRDDSGRLLPGSNVNSWPDGTQWHHSANPNLPYAGGSICDGQMHPVDISSPAFVNLNVQAATGYALLSGLKPGNYAVGAWTQFGNNQQLSFNGGADGQFQWGGQGGNNHRGCFGGTDQNNNPWTSADDLRLTIEESGAINVYDASGTLVMANISSITIVSPVLHNLTGVVHGTLKFSSTADLRSDPISIILNTCDSQGCHGNFTIVDGFGQSSYPYSIDVASADSNGNTPSYNLQTISKYWGVVQQGDGQNQFSFNGSTSITHDLTFAPAGRVVGNLYKPDGSLFQPGQQTVGYLSANINAQGLSNHSWGNAQVNQDGSFLIGGLLPGEYQLIPQVHGAVSYSPKDPPDRVTVAANADISKDVRFVDGEYVQVKMDTNTLPSLETVYNNFGWISGERWEGRRLSAGAVFTPELLIKILNHDGQDSSVFSDIPAGNSGACNGGWTGGFCPQQTPANQTYDFYMMRTGDLDSESGLTDLYSYFTIVAASKSVIVDEAHKTPPPLLISGSTIPVGIHVDFSPSVSHGVRVTGQVTAVNFLRKADFDSFGGSFGNFMKFIPIISLYDDKGILVAAGMVTPTPAYIAIHNREFDNDIAANDWNAFQQLINGDSWHYEIRGVPPNKTYTFVGTTPNYPPVIKTVTTGVDDSTSTVDIDWDAEVGSGATVKGVVQSTSGAVIQGALVEIQAKTIKTRVLTTDNNGNFLTEGLAKGTYKVEASADSFASVAQEVNIVAASTYTVDFTAASGYPMVEAPGIITGTVREISFTAQGPVVKPVSGAKIFAYDDTFNGNNPDKPLALYKVLTSSEGVYTLQGLIPNDVYKISAFAPGRYVNTSTVSAIDGTLSDVDFMLNKIGLTVEVFAKPNTPNYEFSILNPNNFDSGQVWYYQGALGGFSTASPVPVEITNSFHDLPDGSLLGSIPLTDLTDGVNYVLHIEAIPANGGPVVTKEITFGLGTSNSTDQPAGDKLIGDDSTDDAGNQNNEVKLDASGTDNGSLEIPAGSLIPTDTSPTIGMTESDASTVSGQTPIGSRTAAPTFYGPAVNLNLTSVQFTARNVIFNLPFNPQLVGGNIANLEILHLVSGQWVPLLGQQLTIDPLTGVISTKVSGTQLSAQAPLSGSAALRSKAKPSMMAVFDGKQHLINAQAGSSGSGTFAVALAASTGTASATYKQYNFPNPFNLQTKTVTLINGAGGNVATSIRGTYIVVAPTGSGSPEVAIRIYNVAGDMVREIRETSTAGRYNYFHWDGRNTAGSDVASGVYFAVVDAPGSDKKEHVKMVVVK